MDGLVCSFDGDYVRSKTVTYCTNPTYLTYYISRYLRYGVLGNRSSKYETAVVMHREARGAHSREWLCVLHVFDFDTDTIR